MRYREVLFHALQAIRFQPNALAYLALTSKPELQIRDRLGYALFRRGLVAAREWRRADLAILEDGQPVAVVESKAAYTFDMSRIAMDGYDGAICRDIEKAWRLAPRAEVFSLLVLTHVLDPVPRALHGLAKYGRHLAAVADRKGATTNTAAFLKRLGPTSHVLFGDGKAFGIRIAVDGWLCGPVIRR